ncbi:formate dehydrogenase accessory sulfurtransferase FdhD [Eubacterium xylanophilum]|uniref:formate dehydrogenase accessory sulfurtransferase FdhD n=1 Tax=Eubacterium xylanophilum TaxID=39497 RepID=UPI00047914ED|nr:formate dehydrogenase accessory sulfurtransferase FdhD [Eubacterium xylanophilum]
MISKSRITVTSSGSGEREDAFVAREHSILVRVNGEAKLNLTCSDNNLPELIAGRLFTDGFIANKDDILSLEIDEKHVIAEVKVQTNKKPEPTVFPDIVLDNKVVFCLAKVFSYDLPIHSHTQGTHCCFLSDQSGNILFSCEDISRYNSIDKAIGYGVLQGLEMSDTILFTSGRVSELAVRKVLFAGIPVLISKAVPSDKAIELAGRYKLKLVCRAYPDKYDLYE